MDLCVSEPKRANPLPKPSRVLLLIVWSRLENYQLHVFAALGFPTTLLDLSRCRVIAFCLAVRDACFTVLFVCFVVVVCLLFMVMLLLLFRGYLFVCVRGYVLSVFVVMFFFFSWLCFSFFRGEGVASSLLTYC